MGKPSSPAHCFGECTVADRFRQCGDTKGHGTHANYANVVPMGGRRPIQQFCFVDLPLIVP